MYSLEAIAGAMNALGMVKWDRCIVSAPRGAVYGWIAREDGRSDFVLLHWNPVGLGYTTSSARHSKEIGERLGFSGEGHRDCQRVEDVFGGLVERHCRASAGPEADQGEPIEWRQWPPVSTIWEADVTIGDKVHNLMLAHQWEQPEYWLFYRGTGNHPLIVGPGTLDDAKRFAQRWLAGQRRASPAPGRAADRLMRGAGDHVEEGDHLMTDAEDYYAHG